MITCDACSQAFSRKPSEQQEGAGMVMERYRWDDTLVVNGRTIRTQEHPTVCSAACRARLLADRSWLTDMPQPQWDGEGACALPGSLCDPEDVCQKCGRPAREHRFYMHAGKVTAVEPPPPVTLSATVTLTEPESIYELCQCGHARMLHTPPPAAGISCAGPHCVCAQFYPKEITP